MTNAEFVKKHYGQALVASKGSGIFIETLLGQSILETSSGKSLLSSKYNNYFGIKANKAWKGRTVNMKTGEVFNGKSVTINSDFRVYDFIISSNLEYELPPTILTRVNGKYIYYNLGEIQKIILNSYKQTLVILNTEFLKQRTIRNKYRQLKMQGTLQAQTM